MGLHNQWWAMWFFICLACWQSRVLFVTYHRFVFQVAIGLLWFHIGQAPPSMVGHAVFHGFHELACWQSCGLQIIFLSLKKNFIASMRSVHGLLVIPDGTWCVSLWPRFLFGCLRYGFLTSQSWYYFWFYSASRHGLLYRLNIHSVISVENQNLLGNRFFGHIVL